MTPKNSCKRTNVLKRGKTNWLVFNKQSIKNRLFKNIKLFYRLHCYRDSLFLAAASLTGKRFAHLRPQG